MLCHDCWTEEHSDHDREDICSVAAEAREKLSSAQKQIETSVKDDEILLQQAQKEIENFETSLRNAREIMDSKVEAIIKWATDYRRNADTRFDFLKQVGKREMITSVRSLRKHVDDLNSQKEELVRALGPSQSDQYVVRFHELHGKNTSEKYPTSSDLKRHLKKYKLQLSRMETAPNSVRPLSRNILEFRLSFR